ncbi:hypothetical protein GQ53DRAFT_745336 [Thozetella sp. PMI_491]|nr:hypothetical protein GQ53DRAFT_745336 [Thozetella sp. PMI_491]
MAPPALPAETQARLQEVADLLLAIYETLAEMCYIDPVGIIKGPHDMETLHPTLEKMGLDPSIVYLYGIMPYIDTNLAGNRDFLHGGTFVNYLTEQGLERVKDPFYANPSGKNYDKEGGPYMRPWMTPLSQLGNHESVIIYDAKQHRIWIVDQEGWSSTDRGVQTRRNTGFREGGNSMSLEPLPSRPAGDVLRDINQWYRTLEETPGDGEYCGGEWRGSAIDLRGLYRKHGWPDRFDGDGFLVDQARAYAAHRAQFRAEEPGRQVEGLVDSVEWAKKAVANAQDELKNARTENERWLAKYTLWREKNNEASMREGLRKQKVEAEKHSIDGKWQKEEDLPLWELEQLRHELMWKRESVANNQRWAEQTEKPSDREHFRNQVRHLEKYASVYQKAYDAAKADAERLCPGKTFQSATGIKSLGRIDTLTNIELQKEAVASMEKELAQLREWAKQVPDGATEARDAIAGDVEGLESGIKSGQGTIERLEKWVAEHGNTE